MQTSSDASPEKGEVLNPEVIALIDGDVIVYRLGFATQTLIREDDRLVVMSEPPEHALHSLEVMLNSILADTGATHYRIFLTGEGNFRKDVAKLCKYKGKRELRPAEMRRPYHYETLRTALIERYGAEVCHGEEADDALGRAVGFYTETEGEYSIPCICTNDKDLRQIPGYHYDFTHPERGIQTVSELEGIKYFYHQLLTGDTADDIIGIPGIGPAKADKILSGAETEQECEERVVKEYIKFYHEGDGRNVLDQLGRTWHDVLEEQKELLWIRRHNKTYVKTQIPKAETPDIPDTPPWE